MSAIYIGRKKAASLETKSAQFEQQTWLLCYCLQKKKVRVIEVQESSSSQVEKAASSRQCPDVFFHFSSLLELLVGQLQFQLQAAQGRKSAAASSHGLLGSPSKKVNSIGQFSRLSINWCYYSTFLVAGDSEKKRKGRKILWSKWAR